MTQIASLFAQLGFKVDTKNLQVFEKKLQHTRKNIQEASTAFTKDTTQRTKKMNTALASLEKRYFKHSGSVQAMRNDYRRINTEFHQGNISLEKRSRLLGGIANDYREARQEAERLNNVRPHQPAAFQRNIAAVGDRFNGAIARLTGPVLGGAIAGAAVGYGGYMVAGAANRSNKEFQHFQSMVTAFQAITGSVEKAQKTILKLAKIADFYGTNLKAGLENFKNFSSALKGTKLEKQALPIFEGFSAFATSLSLNTQQQANATRALSQMASKGTISSEELFGQLAEALPGAVQIFTKAGGFKNQSELRNALGNGEIQAVDILPKVARLMRERAFEGGGLEKARTNTLAVQNRLDNIQYLAHIKTNVDGLDAAVRGVLKQFTESMKQNAKSFKAIGVVSENIANNLVPAIKGFADSIGDMSRFYLKNQDAIDTTTSAIFEIIDAPREALVALFSGISDSISNIIDLWGNEDTNFFVAVVKSLDELTRPIVEVFSLITGKAHSLVELLTGFDIPNPLENVGTVGEGLEKGVKAALKVFDTPVKMPLLDDHGGIAPNKLPFGPVVIDPKLERSLRRPTFDANLMKSIAERATVNNTTRNENLSNITNNSSQSSTTNNNTTQEFIFNIESSEPVDVGNEVERALTNHYRNAATSHQITEK